MDTHVQRLGAISIAFGALGMLVAVVTLWYFGGMGPLFDVAEEQRLGMIAVGLVSAQLIFGIPCIIIGLYLRRLQSWARLGMICLCGMNILNPPVGSVFGLYGLWVLMSPETDPLFQKKRPGSSPVGRGARLIKTASKTTAARGRSISHAEIKAIEPHLPE